ncbi:UbiH/UbiF/VisC/COQ6 family ubiquinone biosynthesis hydroxylase [Halochromatium salexigens]|uniref:2-octaprenyl-3-methyl-6-methoxy-1,4-benzoquinol hydroxylase n=1 Tax=Halochromatium salexigens TaxID=49447 RepID=A0AAJ0UD22_HALSE|nr:UbiH/UbiF/VisC/COQ6 family ubiquinone biosynthesis hydroxylase [Halochromatium salexigens]MBK5929232.1 2-octaprenyl-3-methyl-6-methoxy-1,4-benzoquinol hydroxylase [Halochromatium salexigens]
MSDHEHHNLGHFDIAIVGGGMVGAALGCACAERGLSLALIDGQPPQRTWPAGQVDLRVSALSRASQRILERLGVWPRMVELGVSPYREMQVWDAVGGAEIHFDSADLGEPDLGHIVENRVTRLALWERLEAASGLAASGQASGHSESAHPAPSHPLSLPSARLELLAPAALAALEIDDQQARLRLADQRQLSADLVVGADGRASFVRETLGIGLDAADYAQRAIVANVEVAHWHRETAWQRFLPTGPLAFLPLADGRCSIVWSADEARAEQLLALDDAGFIAELEVAFDKRLGPILSAGPRAAFPLNRQHARAYVRPRAALVGDAAHGLHPLAGQGVNLGFLDVAALVDAIDHARAKGRSLGSLHILRRYERARRGDNATMVGAMDLFKRVFGNRHPALVGARTLGLAAAEHLPGVKPLFIRQALGLGKDLPTLARVG